ncbi:amino acid kinase family protein, partial [Orientia tsutsugamushi str. Sido]
MNIIVQKFGGACVADTAKIANLVTKVQREIDASNKVIVVVSAMAGITKKLISFCYNLNSELYTPETL